MSAREIMESVSDATNALVQLVESARRGSMERTLIQEALTAIGRVESKLDDLDNGILSGKYQGAPSSSGTNRQSLDAVRGALDELLRGGAVPQDEFERLVFVALEAIGIEAPESLVQVASQE